MTETKYAENAKKAAKNYHKRQEDKGLKRTPFYIDQETAEKLDKLSKQFNCGKQFVLNHYFKQI